jgi:hypothetical protein
LLLLLPMRLLVQGLWMVLTLVLACGLWMLCWKVFINVSLHSLRRVRLLSVLSMAASGGGTTPTPSRSIRPGSGSRFPLAGCEIEA